MPVVRSHPLIEQIMADWREPIGPLYDGYRGHVYRMFNCCLALQCCSREEQDQLAIAAAFHDLGLWSARTLDYLPPSVVLAQQWLRCHGHDPWSADIGLMIDFHHKLRPYRGQGPALVELFRKADLVDFSRGLIRFGLSTDFIKQLGAEWPNAGFHRFLLVRGARWLLQHPLRPAPFLKW